MNDRYNTARLFIIVVSVKQLNFPLLSFRVVQLGINVRCGCDGAYKRNFLSSDVLSINTAAKCSFLDFSCWRYVASD